MKEYSETKAGRDSVTSQLDRNPIFILEVEQRLRWITE
jgi:hypothetical protein